MEWVADHSRVLMALFALGCLGFAVWSANVDRTQSGDIEGLGVYVDQRVEEIIAAQESARVATDLGACERGNVSRSGNREQAAISAQIAALIGAPSLQARAEDLAVATFGPIVCSATIQAPP